MGSPISVTVANLVMEEDRALSSYDTDVFWKRFVDDVCTSLPVDKIQLIFTQTEAC